MTKSKIIGAGLFAALLGVLLPLIVVFAGNGCKSMAGNGFQTTKSGLQYRIVKDNKQRKAAIGDYMRLHFVIKTDKDSTISSSRAMNGNQPLEIRVEKPKFAGDFTEGLAMLGAGDSAEFKMKNDSIFKGQPMPPFAKPGGFMHMYVNVVSVMTQAEHDAKTKSESEQQMKQEEPNIQAYLKSHNLNAQKTASGLYYVIEKQGDGPKVEAGKQAMVNYTGRTIDDKVFDSSTDSAFHHVQPLPLTVGQGQVIKGWDEGLQLFNKGGKGKLIIPSALGYGSRGAGGAIPPNAVLIFDVEIVDVK